jgi:hypothetical protein
VGAIATAVLALAAAPSPAQAANTQTVTAQTTAGVLTISAPSAISLGTTLAPGSTVAAFALGSLSWTDTLDDATASTATLAATDLYNGPAKFIPYANFSIGPGQAVNTQAGNAGSTPLAGAAGPTALTGGDTTPGTTFSDPLTLASASATTEGTWTQPDNTITVTVPANLVSSGLLTATVQYTITG